MAFRGARAKKAGKYKRVKRKVCNFCVEHIDEVDYKNSTRLRKFVSDRGKILPRRTTGTCAGHQRILAAAIKRAREIALLPFTAE
jgi:small subunit ribosomal protein S18